MKEAPLVKDLQNAKFFFKQKYGMQPDTLGLSPTLVKALYRYMKNNNLLPTKPTEIEFLGCEVRVLEGCKSPWEFQFEITQGGQRYVQHAKMDLREEGVNDDFTKIIHPGVVELNSLSDAPEAEVLTSGESLTWLN